VHVNPNISLVILLIICASLRDSIARRILTLFPKGDARRGEK
jgi:hypothetical protein